MKELNCLVQLSRLSDMDGSLMEILQKAVELLPDSLQFPDIAAAGIQYSGQILKAGNIEECKEVLARPLEGRGSSNCVEIGYLSSQSFLPEEARLMEIVAEWLSRLIERFETREELRKNERSFQLLADNTLDVIWSVNMELEVTYVNAAITTLTGYTPAQYVGTHVREHFSQSELQAVHETIEEALSAGRDHSGTIREFNCLDRDGNEIPVEIHAKVLYDEGGNPRGFQGTSRDLRERRRSQNALRRSEEQYRTLFDTMAQGAVLQNWKGEIVSANPAAERILGLSLEEMKGRSSDDRRWRAIREDGTEYPAEEHPSMVALRTGQQAQNGLMGVFNPVDDDYRWLKVSASPQFRLGEDIPFQVFSTFEDVTKLRRLDAQRRAANLFATELLESVRDGFLALDRDLRVTYINGAAEALLGKERQELVGDRLPEALPRVQGSQLFENFQRSLADNSRLEFETFYEPHGRWYDTQIFPRANGISVFFRDVSARKRAEKERQEIESQLLQAQKMEAIGRLAGGLAHDFNNMLSVILGHSELALTSLSVDDPLHGDLTEIIRAGQRSAALTRQLLAFARKQTIAPRVLEVNAAVSNALRMLKRLIGEDVELDWRPSEEALWVKMDPSQLDQVLANLVVNARDAIEGVGQIAIETGPITLCAEFCEQREGLEAGRYVKLAVRDTGTGIEPAIMSKLCEPFFTTKPEGRGTGLGLSMIHGVVQQNGGTLEITSEIGVGSTFEIYLPAVSIDEGEEELVIAEVGNHPGEETILIVEDEASLLNLAARMLRDLGYKVVKARSPKEALQFCQEHFRTPDLLLTDVVMPEMNGAQLSAQLKAIYPELRCLFMSGYTSEAIGERGGVLDNGVHFLQKPFTKEELSRKVRDAFDWKVQ